MGKVCGVRDGLAMSQDGWRLTVMQGRKSEEADAGVVVLFVVPAEQFDGKSTGVLDRAEAGWEARSILQGAELAFRVGVFVGDVRAAVGFGHTEIAEQKSNRCRKATGF